MTGRALVSRERSMLPCPGSPAVASRFDDAQSSVAGALCTLRREQNRDGWANSFPGVTGKVRILD